MSRLRVYSYAYLLIACLPDHLSVCLPACLPVRPSVCLSVRMYKLQLAFDCLRDIAGQGLVSSLLWLTGTDWLVRTPPSAMTQNTADSNSARTFLFQKSRSIQAVHAATVYVHLLCFGSIASA